MEKISVIIPVYGVEKYLNRCVNSVVNQTYKNLEIILVDDGSPDNCPLMRDAWAEKDSRVKVIHKKNGGLSSARNAGMDIMTGSFVGFIDSDDTADSEMFEKMYNAVTADNCDMCVCNNSHMDENYNIIDKSDYKCCELKGKEAVMQGFFNEDKFDSRSACNKLYKCSVISNYNLRFDENIKWGEDYPFNYFFLKKANKIISIEDVLYNYLMKRNGSITFGITKGSISRWKLVRTPLLNEKNNEKNYHICLKNYAVELFCTLRELLKSKNGELISQCFPEITNEIKSYYKQFMHHKNISGFAKISFSIINISPSLFKAMFSLYLKLMKGKTQTF
ncbi:MAG: glycosyltransferase [Clostridiales bacterium]|nr:glycosyltransferase [Clostridiales bacterium]